MRTITTIGLDIAKSVFQVHGVDAVGQVVIQRQLKRRRTVCAFAVVTFICAVTYGTSHAAPIAPLTGITNRSPYSGLFASLPALVTSKYRATHAPLWLSTLLVAPRPVSLVSLWPGTLGVLV